ncbi:hypothetical protein KO528_01325 [Saccharophagus degradans]|uniref:Uncharacterized protein n=1 Tax=Saccharophagus degradans TaxID=86304 RepID=A0AAW7X1S4_9GAMM|nr:hypothetical protein [Saccharophagus degradans]MBU2983978.1 hypothetical protein [Saccharophagus degradans]MDO6421686.1 hypothetical protein [Saccharophagus degradans]MDO6609804.1 hypothetical protein [Saccharophagus degradans]
MGAFFLAAHFFGDRFLESIPPKSELVEVSGEIEWANRASKKGRDVRFKIKEEGTFVHNGFGSSLAQDIHGALTGKGINVTVFADLTEIQKPMGHEYSYHPVYEVIANGVVVRSYEESVASEKRGALLFPWVGLLFVIGSIYEYRKHRRRYWFKT